MKKSITLMLIASAILIAGIMIAGCTSSTSTTQSSDSSASSATPAVSDNSQSSGQNAAMTPSGTMPAGDQTNSTAPSGAPAGGEMNGTAPSGTPTRGRARWRNERHGPFGNTPLRNTAFRHSSGKPVIHFFKRVF